MESFAFFFAPTVTNKIDKDFMSAHICLYVPRFTWFQKDVLYLNLRNRYISIIKKEMLEISLPALDSSNSLSYNCSCQKNKEKKEEKKEEMFTGSSIYTLHPWQVCTHFKCFGHKIDQCDYNTQKYTSMWHIKENTMIQVVNPVRSSMVHMQLNRH